MKNVFYMMYGYKIICREFFEEVQTDGKSIGDRCRA